MYTDMVQHKTIIQTWYSTRQSHCSKSNSVHRHSTVQFYVAPWTHEHSQGQHRNNVHRHGTAQDNLQLLHISGWWFSVQPLRNFIMCTCNIILNLTLHGASGLKAFRTLIISFTSLDAPGLKAFRILTVSFTSQSLSAPTESQTCVCLFHILLTAPKIWGENYSTNHFTRKKEKKKSWRREEGPFQNEIC